jgi:chlorobactene lauroyltransferase
MAGSDFIPAAESRFHLAFFTTYSRLLYATTFAHVGAEISYRPVNGQSTLYLVNHNYWFDALTPLLLNRYAFRQRLRAVMEDTQLRKHPFFKRLGAFSINRSHPRSAIRSLDVAADWLNQEGHCLFLYPEGKLVDATVPISIESGVLRVIANAPMADVVPLATHIHFMRGPKPVLLIRSGDPIRITDQMPKALALQTLQQAMREQKNRLVLDAMSGTRYPSLYQVNR